VEATGRRALGSRPTGTEKSSLPDLIPYILDGEGGGAGGGGGKNGHQKFFSKEEKKKVKSGPGRGNREGEKKSVGTQECLLSRLTLFREGEGVMGKELEREKKKKSRVGYVSLV